MKIPCEVIVWQVLPLIRRELAGELVYAHGMSQSDVAKAFGVTDAAISQYLNRKRGGEYSSLSSYPKFAEKVRESADRIASGKSEFGTELCQLCVATKKIGLFAEIYRKETGVFPPNCENSFNR